MPRRIAVISSDSGAAIHDVRVTLARRFPLARVTLFPVLVQGAQSAAQLRAAVGQLSADAFDVALIVRGGGSLSDLWSFNDETLVRALRDSPVPTISGVGHETDVTLCDLAADRRAATPTGAAELATPVTVADMREQLTRRGERIQSGWQAAFQSRSQQVDELGRGLVRGGPGSGCGWSGTGWPAWSRHCIASSNGVSRCNARPCATCSGNWIAVIPAGVCRPCAIGWSARAGRWMAPFRRICRSEALIWRV